MKIRSTDFNGADAEMRGQLRTEWNELQRVLESLPLHLKASDQRGKQGLAIFDPVGTNAAIRAGLKGLGWGSNLPIPDEYTFLGSDIDFAKGGVIVEAQFSNYPFLLNNLLRSELFFKANLRFTAEVVRAAIILTKDGMFPASNSTLYYQQAERQLTALADKKVFSVPLRLLGLYEEPGTKIPTKWTQYDNPRYSRTIVECKDGVCTVPTSGRRFVVE